MVSRQQKFVIDNPIHSKTEMSQESSQEYFQPKIIWQKNKNIHSAEPPKEKVKWTLSAIFRITLNSQDILITGDPKILVQFRFKLPNKFFETIIKCVWL